MKGRRSDGPLGQEREQAVWTGRLDGRPTTIGRQRLSFAGGFAGWGFVWKRVVGRGMGVRKTLLDWALTRWRWRAVGLCEQVLGNVGDDDRGSSESDEERVVRLLLEWNRAKVALQH